MMRTLRERGGEVVVAGDGRADSPGHCAKYGVYSLIDMNSGQVIGLHLVQVINKNSIIEYSRYPGEQNQNYKMYDFFMSDLIHIILRMSLDDSLF
jgi:hypothetical protein